MLEYIINPPLKCRTGHLDGTLGDFRSSHIYMIFRTSD